jgi:hypothetical protein
VGAINIVETRWNALSDAQKQEVTILKKHMNLGNLD